LVCGNTLAVSKKLLNNDTAGKNEKIIYFIGHGNCRRQYAGAIFCLDSQLANQL